MTNQTVRYIIGYGTFLFPSVQQHFKLIPLEVVKIHGYQRIFHPHLPYQFPFLWKAGPEKFFKGILLQIAKKSLSELDTYEGVPKLYKRIKYPLELAGKAFDPCYLYTPSEFVKTRLQTEIEIYLTPPEQEILFETDLWLEYLREYEPSLEQKFPSLFSS